MSHLSKQPLSASIATCGGSVPKKIHRPSTARRSMASLRYRCESMLVSSGWILTRRTRMKKDLTPDERAELKELRADVRSLVELFEHYRDRLDAPGGKVPLRL